MQSEKYMPIIMYETDNGASGGSLSAPDFNPLFIQGYKIGIRITGREPVNENQDYISRR